MKQNLNYLKKLKEMELEIERELKTDQLFSQLYYNQEDILHEII